MIGSLVLVGLVVGAFGVATRGMLGETTNFVALHLAAAGACLAAAAVLGLVRLARAPRSALLLPTLRALGGGLAVVSASLLLGWLGARANLHFDWTFEGRFALADATVQVLDELPGPLSLALYFDAGDPRIRGTRLLLDEMARGRDVDVRTLALDEHPDDEDRYGIGSSNTVVVSLGDDFALVDRPTEGALFQAISSLVRAPERVLYFAVGAGEGDLERGDDAGFSGLRAALESEGFEVRPLPLALVDAIPADADALVSLAPERALPDEALAAIAAYLDEGGRLVAFVEPGRASGIETLLASLGVTAAPGRVVDPASGPVEGDLPGRSPVAAAYAEHPVTRGLDANRMTFFRGARAFTLHKASPDDRLRAVVFTSGRAWIEDDTAAIDPGARPPTPPEGARLDYQALVVAAEVARGERTARVVAFGDADLARNRNLRALYNLDLVVNAVHWVTEQESRITIRPKLGGRQLVQFPVPLQASLQALYGVGLLVPEILLIVGALIWLRTREA